ncbi:MAG: hypothetical protein M1831_003714 [Alyxoria varia]|nr:MAG: hypothetical protein M1831_003714 [Alyxoria varia]
MSDSTQSAFLHHQSSSHPTKNLTAPNAATTTPTASTATTTTLPTQTITTHLDLCISLLLSLWGPMRLAVSENWGGSDSADKRDWLAGRVSEVVTPNANALEGIARLVNEGDGGGLTDQTNGASQIDQTDQASVPNQASGGSGIGQNTTQEAWTTRIKEGESDLQEDLEVLILDVMEEEFGVVLEDESEVDIARDILRHRRSCLAGDFSEVRVLQRRWEEKERRRRGGGGGIGEIGINRAQGDEGESSESASDEEDAVRDGDGDVGMTDATPPLVSRKTEPEVDEEGFVKVGRRKR